MLHEYHVIYGVRCYPWFHVSTVGLGTHYPRKREHYCTYIHTYINKMYVYVYAYVPYIRKYVTKTLGCGISRKYTKYTKFTV
jgi:hypothetical protein